MCWRVFVRCIRCGSEKISGNYKRNQFECTPCGYHFSVTAGTIFHDSHLPLRKWFIAITQFMFRLTTSEASTCADWPTRTHLRTCGASLSDPLLARIISFLSNVLAVLESE